MRRKEIRKIFTLTLIVLIVAIMGFNIYNNYYMKPNKIVFISKSTNRNYVFWETIRMGAELAAKEENVEIEYVGPLEERDVDTQRRLLERCIKEKVDIILLAAGHNEKLSDLVNQAIEQKIAVITVDSTVEGVPNIRKVATNNEEAAVTLTHYLAETIGETGEVIMLNFIQGTSTAIDREKGYEKAIRLYSDIIKRDTIYTEGTSQSAYAATLEIIKQYPNIKGIIGANQYMIEGIYTAVEELGLLGEIKVVGFDGSPLIIQGIEKGGIDAIVTQKPFNMGYLGVKNALKLFHNRSINRYIDTGYKLIDKDTLYNIENQKLLYPIIK